MAKAIYLDLDGTVADLYGVENWLPMLRAKDATPYAIAKPLVNMQVLARLLNRKQREGYTIGVISWLSKEPTPEYDRLVTEAKCKWLHKHLASVSFDEIHIVAYGTPKSTVAHHKGGILFDDEAPNRQEWEASAETAIAHSVENLLEILKNLS